MGKKNRIIIRENRTGEVVRSVIDITKAKTDLGYEPQVPIEEGIARSITWYHEYYTRHSIA